MNMFKFPLQGLYSFYWDLRYEHECLNLSYKVCTDFIGTEGTNMNMFKFPLQGLYRFYWDLRYEYEYLDFPYKACTGFIKTKIQI